MNSRQLEVDNFIKENKANNVNEEELPSSFTDVMRRFYLFRINGECGECTLDYGFRMAQDTFKREIIEGLLLSNADPAEVYEIFGVPEESYSAYKHIYFDVDKFISRLDKLSYVESYKGTSFGKEIKVRALAMGPEFIYYTYGNMTPTTDIQKSLLKKMFLSSAYRAMEMNFNSMNSSTSKAAVEMAKIMMRSYDAMDKLMGEKSNIHEDIVSILTDRKLSLTAQTRNLTITTEDLI